MQRKKLSSKLQVPLFVAMGTLALGIILLVIGLGGLYGDVNKCGFGAAGNCQNSNTHSNLAVAGEYIAGASFMAIIILLITFLVVRVKEKRPSAISRN